MKKQMPVDFFHMLTGKSCKIQASLNPEKDCTWL